MISNVADRQPPWRGGNALAALLLIYARKLPPHPSKLRLFRMIAPRLFPNGLLLIYARKLPPHPSKLRLFRMIAPRLFPNGLPVTSTAGVRLLIDPLDFIGHNICWSGAFEPESLALAVRLMSTGGVFLDIGCNFGLFTCCVARESVKCIAVDPSPIALVRIQQNVALNANASIVVVATAVGGSRSLACLTPPLPGNLGTRRIGSPTGDSSREQYVPTIPIDELLLTLGVERVKLMKLDIEGYELEALRGLNLQSCHAPENIISEHSARAAGNQACLTACEALLESSGYKPFTVTGRPYFAGVQLIEENLWWRRVDSSV
jgi:FkbM family methyltransferase